MVDNTTEIIHFGGHDFPVAIHDNYFELFFAEVSDSRMSMGYRGPFKKNDDLPESVREVMTQRPDVPYMWRKCKTVLKVGGRCNEDVWNGATEDNMPRAREARLYLSELCRAHIPIINSLIMVYRLSTYDYFPFELSPWDVPFWQVERDGQSIGSSLVGYREWDVKPFIFPSFDPSAKPEVYKLINADNLRQNLSYIPTAGELELLDALNLMERGD